MCSRSQSRSRELFLASSARHRKRVRDISSQVLDRWALCVRSRAMCIARVFEIALSSPFSSVHIALGSSTDRGSLPPPTEFSVPSSWGRRVEISGSRLGPCTSSPVQLVVAFGPLSRGLQVSVEGLLRQKFETLPENASCSMRRPSVRLLTGRSPAEADRRLEQEGTARTLQSPKLVNQR